MAIGVMLTFFDFRNDIRKLISSISKKEKVVVFVRKEHEHLVSSYQSIDFTYRIIDEQHPSIINFLLTRCFLLFRKIPASRNNYYLMEAFKAEGLPDKKQSRKAKKILKWQKLLPKFFSYDKYLSMLRPSKKTDLGGINSMLVLTEIYDDLLFARIIKSKLPTHVYVYSWDHPCKHVRFSKKVNYLVWNKGISEDLQKLQQIPENQVSVIGSTQLGYIHEYLRQSAQEFSAKQNCIYYACGVGIRSLVHEEVSVIITLAKAMQATIPDHKLLVRPYPNLSNWNLYDALADFDNIIVDSSYRQTDLSVSEKDIFLKFSGIDAANALFHTGTTLGLEACFLNTPSFIIDIANRKRSDVCLYNFVHQYQNNKYLIEKSPINVVYDEKALHHILQNTADPIYMHLNKDISSAFEVLSFDDLAANFLNHLS